MIERTASYFYEVQPALSGVGYVVVSGRLPKTETPRLNTGEPYIVFPSIEQALDSTRDVTGEVTVSPECEAFRPYVHVEFSTDGEMVDYNVSSNIPDEHLVGALTSVIDAMTEED